MKYIVLVSSPYNQLKWLIFYNISLFDQKFLWILSLFVVFCKSYKFYYDDPEYERLKKMLGVSEIFLSTKMLEHLIVESIIHHSLRQFH